MTRWIVTLLAIVCTFDPSGIAKAAVEAKNPHRPVHRSVPYLDTAVSPAVAAVIRVVRKYEPRMVREDAGQVVALDNRYARAAAKAVTRYERAADQGYVMAHYNLARTLADGRGVARNYDRALASFTIAAGQGNVPAMLRLAEFYLAGLSVPKNRVVAQAYYYVAASIQNQAAVRAQGLLAPHLSQDQLEQVRRHARALRDAMPPIDLMLQQGRERDLLKAAAQGNPDRVEALLQDGVDANAINALGRTAIITAAWRGHVHIVRSLLDAGVEIDAADNEGRTALSWAAINGFPKIVDLLLEEAALVDVRDDKGLTPLIRAAWNGHEDIVAALIAGDADIMAADDRGVTALQRAEAVNEQRIAELLRTGPGRRSREAIVLLADDNGTVGALALLNQQPDGREIMLNKVNEMLRVDQTGRFATGTASKAFLEAAFGDLLQDLPAAPQQVSKRRATHPGNDEHASGLMAFLARFWPYFLLLLVVSGLLLFFRIRRR